MSWREPVGPKKEGKTCHDIDGIAAPVQMRPDAPPIAMAGPGGALAVAVLLLIANAPGTLAG